MKPKNKYVRVVTKLNGNKFYEGCVFLNTEDGQLIVYKVDEKGDNKYPQSDDMTAVFSSGEWSFADYTSDVY